MKFVSIIHNYQLHQKQNEIKLLAQDSELLRKDKKIKTQQTVILTERLEEQRKKQYGFLP